MRGSGEWLGVEIGDPRGPRGNFAQLKNKLLTILNARD